MKLDWTQITDYSLSHLRLESTGMKLCIDAHVHCTYTSVLRASVINKTTYKNTTLFIKQLPV